MPCVNARNVKTIPDGMLWRDWKLQISCLFPTTRNSCTTRTVMELSQVPCIWKYDSKTSCTGDDASTRINEQPSQGLRSKSKPLNTELCVFCQTTVKRKVPFSKKLIHATQKDNVLSCRLASMNDLVAGNVRYHFKCYVKWPNETIEPHVQRLDTTLAKHVTG